MAAQEAKWTVLTYIAAHNNLDACGQRSLQQIMEVGSTPEVKLAVLFDGMTNAVRYIVGKPGKAAVEEPLTDFDSGDGEGLLDTVRWAFEQCPAERYGLILWSHGTGWRPEEITQIARQVRGDTQVDARESATRAAAPGSRAFFRSTLGTILQLDKPVERAICFDDGTGHSLDALELARVTAAIQTLIGQPLDFLGMDACLMATLEIAYQVRTSVGCLVASQEFVPTTSWPYDTVFGALRATPEQSAQQLARLVVREYALYYTAHPPPSGDITKVALDLSHVGDLVTVVNELAQAIQITIDGQADLLWSAQYDAVQQESRQNKRNPTKFRYHLWDVGSLSMRLAGKNPHGTLAKAAAAVDTALQAGGCTILAEEHRGDWFSGIRGVSIYLPFPKKQRISPYYADLALAQDTRWDEMLAAYHKHYV